MVTVTSGTLMPFCFILQSLLRMCTVWSVRLITRRERVSYSGSWDRTNSAMCKLTLLTTSSSQLNQYHGSVWIWYSSLNPLTHSMRPGIQVRLQTVNSEFLATNQIVGTDVIKLYHKKFWTYSLWADQIKNFKIMQGKKVNKRYIKAYWYLLLSSLESCKNVGLFL